MSRRYRAPVKRRKAKNKTTVSDLLGVPAEPEALAPTAPSPLPPPASKPRIILPAAPVKPSHHIERDYTYVLSDLLRISVILGLILIGLVVTALFIR